MKKSGARGRAVRVALSSPLERPLTYLLEDGVEPLPGLRVEVPLRGRSMTGFILGEEENLPAGVRLKPVDRVLDKRPLFPPEMMALFNWLAEYYRHPLGQVISTALPLANSLRPARSKAEKSIRVLDLPNSDSPPKLGPVQQELLEFINGKAWIPFRLIRRIIPGADNAAKGLAAKGLAEIRYQETRLEKTDLGREYSVPRELSPEQTLALEQLGPALESREFAPFLLHGVTGSGKTEVYLRAGEKTLEQGRAALILVPEIALTPALTGQFEARFQDRVAVLHSGLTPAERMGEWLRLLEGRARVALGARSAVFAPLTDLGLIVVDEEHEPSYKQEDGLRYQARDVALVRGRMSGSVVVLGSATPSVVSHYHQSQGKYRGLAMSRRIMSRPLPQVEVVDLSQEPLPEKDGNKGALFSARLVREIRETLGRGRQVLLFLNRRGFASYPVCSKCGRPFVCENCSVTMTYHSGFGALVCHYCGSAQSMGACSKCGHGEPKLLGIGTERIQEEAAALFPEAKVARLDSDVTGGFRTVQATLRKLGRGEIDILVGTQMLAKGHDYPGIQLVGVVLADLSLNLPDFRAAERTFQLLTQVAGRSGRGDDPGKVIIQTFNPEHYSLIAAAGQDYTLFVGQELEFRRQLFYPPFSRLINLRLSGTPGPAVERAGRRLAGLLRQEAAGLAPKGSLFVLGPAPAPIVKVKNRFRWRILIKARTSALGGALLDRIADSLGRLEEMKNIRLDVDVDPMNMM